MVVSCQRGVRVMEENQEVREQNQTSFRYKLQFLDILDEALIIPSKSLRFIIFACLTCLPFLCFLIFFEMILQKTFLETSAILGLSIDYYNGWSDSYWPPVPFDTTKRITRTLSPKLIKLFLLYIVPYHLLELFHISAVVHMASKFYAGEKLDSLKEMVNFTRLKGVLITSLYVVFLSTCSLFGLTWIIANYHVLTKGFRFGFGSYYYSYYSYGHSFYSVFDTILYMLIFVFHGLAFVALLMKYMEWSARWNMSVVISVMEDSYGSDAFDLSGYFSRGSKWWKGGVLMLVFFTWGMVFRLPCLLGGCYTKRGGLVLTFVYTSLICVGNVMKWVVCVVYYFDCKKRVLEKKFDEENGGES